MSRVWFSTELETVATFWRVLRRDGVTFGFTSHDRDLWFDGVLHLSAPGMIPSSIRKTGNFEPDSAEVQGALSHASITGADLSEGRFDGARVRIGLVDWESGEVEVLYRGEIGSITEEAGQFSAELRSRKHELFVDPVPRTGPGCRAQFCGPGCNLDPLPFDSKSACVGVDLDRNAIRLDPIGDSSRLAGGRLRWFDGPHAGMSMTVMVVAGDWLILDWPLSPAIPAGVRVTVREGCDHTIETCATRFANAANFQGEPFLPGNDMVSRYPTPGQ